ncbi:hypothetical protein CC80DRAFT_481601 [Byssothecium circinans]|uniref:Uncharacterized protein n=1 Tax=Byssothecium circinans TaxID=147558 RepID=A0A6A5TGG5_9PLEO|nr:hypothetical protein CC80DRAFT_481601 [Byssothecium circinans]
MSQLSLNDFDKHIANLRSQLQFLNQALDATDHNAPDWLATDLVSLRNKSGRLHDDMQRFKEQLESEGLGSKKTSNKHRLSIEGVKPSSSNTNGGARRKEAISAQNPPTSPPVPTSPPTHSALPPQSAQSQNTYMVEHIDVSEEVNRRLRQNRLRRLMDSPSTSQKRKYDIFEDTVMSSGPETEDDREDVLERGRSGAKKVRVSGTFGGRVGTIEGVLKRKDDEGSGHGGRDEGVFKRRRI